jgi:IS30 family transposase
MYLYDEREWSMTKIAEALGVSTRQISSDLREFEPTSNSGRYARRGGRPRKVDPTLSSEQPSILSPEQKSIVIERTEQGIPNEMIAKEVGTSTMPIRIAQAEERGRREALREPVPTPVTIEQKHCPTCTCEREETS